MLTHANENIDQCMDMESLLLPMPPSANRYWRHVAGMVYVSQEAREYRDLVKWISAGADVKLRTCNVGLSVTVYRVHKRGDIDNYLKVLLDALQGVMYDDDKRIKEVSVKIVDAKPEKGWQWDPDQANGEVKVDIWNISEWTKEVGVS